jgi:mRNA-degrading endonuclease RelE of RelBE toxin-antitoxin system
LSRPEGPGGKPPGFAVLTSPRFERDFRALARRHPDLLALREQLLRTLRTDPANRTRRYDIVKLHDVRPGQGQYRLRLRRFRFRYDFSRATVRLHTCSLRREDTYR